MRLDIKPLSVNKAWQGKRFKTNDNKNYERHLILTLPNTFKAPEGKYFLFLHWGFSSAASDFDNPIKCFTDCLQKKYGFNDKLIKSALIEVSNVKKGEDFIEWDLIEYDRRIDFIIDYFKKR